MAEPTNPKVVPRCIGLTPFQAISEFNYLLLLAKSWGTPELKSLDENRQAWFRDLVERSQVAEKARLIVLVCLQLGVQLTDEAIAVCSSLAGIIDEMPLPEIQRDHLTRINEQLLPLSIREEAKEVTITNDRFPVPYLSGQWVRPMTRTMSLKQCAKLFGKSERRIIEHLNRRGIYHERDGGTSREQGIRVPLDELPKSDVA